jgi:hypothetical protein
MAGKRQQDPGRESRRNRHLADLGALPRSAPKPWKDISTGPANPLRKIVGATSGQSGEGKRRGKEEDEKKKKKPYIRVYDHKIAVLMTLYGTVDDYLASVK